MEENELQVVKGSDIQKLHIDSLTEFIANGKLLKNEVDYFEAANRWAEEECKRQEIEVTPKNKRQVLGPALHEIKFGLLTPEELARSVQPSGILTGDELAEIYSWIILKELPSDEGVLKAFPSIPRAPVLCKTVVNNKCFKETHTCVDQLHTTISVNYPLRLTKLETKITDVKSRVISVFLKETEQGKGNKTGDDESLSEDITSKLQYKSQTILFDKTIELKPCSQYTITLNLKQESFMDGYHYTTRKVNFKHYVPFSDKASAVSSFTFGGICVKMSAICDNVRSIEFECAS